MGQDLCADLLNDYFFEKIEKPFQRMRENFDRDLKTSSFHIDIFFVNLKFQTKHIILVFGTLTQQHPPLSQKIIPFKIYIIIYNLWDLSDLLHGYKDLNKFVAVKLNAIQNRNTCAIYMYIKIEHYRSRGTKP